MRMQLGVWQKIGMLSRGTLSCFMEEPCLGVLNGRRSSPSLPLRVSMLLLLTQQRNHSGFAPFSLNSSLGSLTPPLSSQIINPLSHLPKTTSTMLIPNTSTSDSISFTMSSKRALFDSSIALPMIWLLIRLPKPYHLRKSSILHLNSDLPHLEGECWNIQGDNILRSLGILSPFLTSPFLRTILLIYNLILHPFVHINYHL